MTKLNPLKVEIFKFFKKKSTYVSLVILISIEYISAWIIKIQKISNVKDFFYNSFYATSALVFIMIGMACSIITMEFQDNTLKNLLVQGHKRAEVLCSKWLTLLAYMVLAYVLIYVNDFIIKFTMFPKLKLFSKVGSYTLISKTFAYIGMLSLTMWLVLSIVLLVSSLFKNSGISITVGILTYLSASMIGTLLSWLIKKWSWIKFNPLNMIFLPSQFLDSTVHSVTHLSISGLVTGNICYVILFLILDMLIFEKKSI